MAIKINASQFAQRWGSGLKNSTQKITEGVSAVTESPTAKAAKQLDKAANNYVEAIRSGKTARKLNAVTLEQWKAATLAKAPQRISAGVDGAIPKVEIFAGKLIPKLEEIQGKLKSMPAVTLEENINRMVFQVREMAKFDPSK